MEKKINVLRDSFTTGITRDINWRKKQLNGLLKFLKDLEPEITVALKKDLNKCNFEAVGIDLLSSISEIHYVLKNLDSWIKPIYTESPFYTVPSTSEVNLEPLGVCLVIGAYNYPVTLVLGPLIGAISAGNCAVIKPSELSVEIEKLFCENLHRYLDPNCFLTVAGGVSVNTDLLNNYKWDMIFFTG